MKSVIFTYYSNFLKETFIDSIESLLLNSNKYDELVICSSFDLPTSYLERLISKISVSQVRPVFPYKGIHPILTSVLNVNPLLISGFMYSKADVITLFDPRLFVLESLPPTNDGFHHFYSSSTGKLSTKLLTINRLNQTGPSAVEIFSRIDFSSPSAENDLVYILSNHTAFINKKVNHCLIIDANTDLEIGSNPLAVDLFSISQKQNNFTDLTQRIPRLPSDMLSKASTSIPKSLLTIKKNDGSPVPQRSIRENHAFEPCEMKPLIISYYTDVPGQNQYARAASLLKSQCSRFGVRFDIFEIDSLGEYSKNCLQKPGIILQKLIEHKEPIMWMDCDTSFISPFSEFNAVTEDIGMATHTGKFDMITASPILFNYTPGAFKILREWTVHCSEAIRKDIIELDHDAIKHYVLPSLSDQYSAFLLSENWKDFVDGKHIKNGNSSHNNKLHIFSRVNKLTDDQRWSISKDVPLYEVFFDSADLAVFDQAYSCLMNFSNTSRIKFFFNSTLAAADSDLLRKLVIETGDQVFFDENSNSGYSNVIKVEASPETAFKKDWDIL